MNWIFLLLGHVSLALGLVGAVLPLLPTTPFVLLAAFFYSRGSERIHRWLLRHPRLGPSIRDWQEHGVIRPRAKVACAVLIPLAMVYPIGFLEFPLALKAAALLTVTLVLAFVLSRPSRPRDGS